MNTINVVQYLQAKLVKFSTGAKPLVSASCSQDEFCSSGNQSLALTGEHSDHFINGGTHRLSNNERGLVPTDL